MHTVVEELNLKIGGGLDDVWQNTETKELHIVDYKSTSQKSPGRTITLDDPYKAAYKTPNGFICLGVETHGL